MWESYQIRGTNWSDAYSDDFNGYFINTFYPAISPEPLRGDQLSNMNKGNFRVPVNSYAYIDTRTSLLNSTISFNILIYSSGQLINFFFGCNRSGQGQMLRFDTRAGAYCGFTNTDSWTAYNYPTSGPTLYVENWFQVRIDIDSNGLASWFLDGVLQQVNYNMINVSYC